MSVAVKEKSHQIKEPKGLSDRIKRLRDYYFKGVERAWNNESTSWTTGTPWDVQFNEMTFYIVPETYMLMQTLLSSYRQGARPVVLSDDFWEKTLVERQAWFTKEVMVNYVPKEILPGDLIAGARFNIQASMCLTEAEQKEFNLLTTGKNGARQAVYWFHGHGYGNAGATSGHLIPGYERVLKMGWQGIYQELESICMLQCRTRTKKVERCPAAGNDDIRHHAPGPGSRICRRMPETCCKRNRCGPEVGAGADG
jgi:hypothetical protein